MAESRNNINIAALMSMPPESLLSSIKKNSAQATPFAHHEGGSAHKDTVLEKQERVAERQFGSSSTNATDVVACRGHDAKFDSGVSSRVDSYVTFAGGSTLEEMLQNEAFTIGKKAYVSEERKSMIPESSDEDTPENSELQPADEATAEKSGGQPVDECQPVDEESGLATDEDGYASTFYEGNEDIWLRLAAVYGIALPEADFDEPDSDIEEDRDTSHGQPRGAADKAHFQGYYPHDEDGYLRWDTFHDEDEEADDEDRGGMADDTAVLEGGALFEGMAEDITMLSLTRAREEMVASQRHSVRRGGALPER